MTTKLISLLTSFCFLFSFIFAPAVEGAVDFAGETKLKSRFETALKAPPTPFGLDIPSGIGRITDYKDCGGDTVVINVQDLHCQTEVQRNINRLLETLDVQYGVKEVFVEGAAGDVDTSWLSVVADTRRRKAAADALLENGRLTGAEYYAIVNNRSGLLKGLEDEKLHRENIVRLGRILERKPVYEQKTGKLAKDLRFLETKHFTAQNRKFNKIIEKYRAGKLSPRKYYAVLLKYASNISGHPTSFNPVAVIRLKDYPNLLGYLALLEDGNRLHYKRAGEQLQALLQTLKSILPYSEYSKLLKETDNFSQTDRTFLSLSPVIKKHNINLEDRYADLARLLAYMEQSRRLNPVALIDEEKRLTSAIRLGLSQNVAELEVSFLADFLDCFRDYLLNRLSADDYRYFTARFDKFKTLWAKYTYGDELKELSADCALLDEFYRVNDVRNGCFLKNMAGSLDAAGSGACDNDLKGRNVIVTVTGGFHTAGLTKILEGRNISCVTITPNVTGDAGSSARIYADLARQQAQVFGNQSLQLMLTSHKAKVFSADEQKIVLLVEDRYITLQNNEGKFEITSVENPQNKKMSMVAPDVLKAIQTAVNHAYRISLISFEMQNAVNPFAMTKFLYALTVVFGTYAADEGLWQGDGLIWAIARDKGVQAAIREHEGLEPEDLAKLMEPVQQAIALHAVSQQHFGKNSLSDAVLSVQRLQDFLDQQNEWQKRGWKSSIKKGLLTATAVAGTVAMMVALNTVGVPHEISASFGFLITMGKESLQKIAKTVSETLVHGRPESPVENDEEKAELKKRWEKFYDPEDGFDLELYIAAITYLLDNGTMDRERLVKALKNNTLGEELPRLMQEQKKLFFLLQPKRLETLLTNQAGEQLQAIVELLNNGFDAMGDAVGRFGIGGFQAVGMLEKEGDSLTYDTVSDTERESRYIITYKKTRDRTRIQFHHEPSTVHTPYTDVLLHKTVKKLNIWNDEIREYVQKKMGLSRRGPIFNSATGFKPLMNDLSEYRHGRDRGGNDLKVLYWLRDRGVRFWVDREGLHVSDSGSGLSPLKTQADKTKVSVILESLPVPYNSTNRTSIGLQAALKNNDLSADGEALMYKGEGIAQRMKIAIEVGGNVVETIELDGERLPDGMAIDLPIAAGQTPSRDQILLDEVTVTAFKGIIDLYVERFRENPVEYAPVMNALSLLMSRLQNSDRAKNRDREENLEWYIGKKMRETIPALDRTYATVPNIKGEYLAPGALEGKTPVYLNEELWEFDPSTIGGEQVAALGKSVWKVDGLKIPYARIGKNIILISKDEYDYFMDAARRFDGQGSLLLNLLFGLWIGYGEKSSPEVELKVPVSVASKNRHTVEVQALMEEAEVPHSLRSSLALSVYRSLIHGLPADDIRFKLKHMVRLLQLREDISSLDDMFAIEITRHGYLIENVHAGGRYFVTIKEPNEDIAVYEIDHRREAKKLASIKNGSRYAFHFFNTRVYISIEDDDTGRNMFYAIDNGGNLRNMFPGMLTVEPPFETQGRTYLKVCNQEMKANIYELNKDGNVSPPLFPGVGAGRIVRYTIQGNTYLSCETVASENENSIDNAIYALGKDGKPTRILSIAPDDKVSNVLETNGYMYVKIITNGKEIMHQIIGDGNEKPAEEEKKRDVWRSSLSLHDEEFSLGGRQFKWIHKDNFYVLYEFKNREQVKVLSGNYNPFWVEAKVMDGRVFLGYRYRVTATGFKDRWYELGENGTKEWFTDGDVHSVHIEEVHGRIFAKVVKNSRDNDGLSLLYEITGDRTTKIGIPPASYIGTPVVIQGHLYARAILSKGTETIDSVQEIFPDGEAYTVFQTERSHISISSEVPYIFLLSPNYSVTALPFVAFDQVASGGVLPTSEEIRSFTYGATAEERERLFRNLLRYSWTSEDMKGLGWLLAYVHGQQVKGLSGPAREALQEQKNADSRYQRKIGLFMDSLARQGITGDRYNELLLRWFFLYESDRNFATNGFLEMLDASYAAGNGEVTGWELLKEDYQKEDIPPQQAMIRYLRNEQEIAAVNPGQRAKLPDGSGSLEVIRDVPLSMLAGVTQNLTVVQEKKSDTSVKDVKKALRKVKGTFVYTENAIRRIMVTTGHEWLRENVQNGVKALLWRQQDNNGEELEQKNRIIEVTAVPVEEGEKTFLEVSTRDHGSGMDVSEILEYLLALDRTGYREGGNKADGFNGRGWSRNLAGSDRIRLISGKPDSKKFEVLEAHREKAGDDTTWKMDRFEEFTGEFEGTEMTWIKEYKGSFEKNRTIIGLQVALVEAELQKYVGALPASRENKIDVTFNGHSIAEKVVTMAEETWGDNEKVRIVNRSSGLTGVIQSGYFVMDIDHDPDLWELLPEFLKDFMAKEKLTLEIPSSLLPDIDRNGLAGKQNFINLLQKAVLSAVLKAAAVRISYDLPRDYMYRSEHLRIDYPGVAEAAAAINDGGWDTMDMRRLNGTLENPSKRIHLLANLKVFAVDGKLRSLSDIQKETQSAARGEDKAVADQTLLPSIAQAMVDETLNDPTHRRLAAARAKDDVWKKRTPATYTEAEQALARFISDIMTPLARRQLKNETATYRVSYGESAYPRMAIYGPDWISLNTEGEGRKTHQWISWFERYRRGETNTAEDYRILWDIVETVLHEHTHVCERIGNKPKNGSFLQRMTIRIDELIRLLTSKEEETHNEAFRQRMLDQVLELIDLRIAPEETARRIKEEYTAETRRMAAILGENLPGYLKTVSGLRRLRLPENVAKVIGLSIVHMKEYAKIMTLSPVEFDLAHGSGNKARRELAATMQADGRNAERNAVSGVKAALAAALTGGGLSLLTFAGVGLLALTRARTAGEWAGMLVTGVRHVRYDMQADIPEVSEPKSTSTEKALPESQAPPVVRRTMPAVSKALAIVLLIGALVIVPAGKKAKDDKEYEDGKVRFYDEEYGFDLRLYISAIGHLVDVKKMNREKLLASLRADTLGKDLSDLIDNEKAAGFVHKPRRIDTLLKRQSGEQYQAIVEILNNGFDAMGDAIGRFGEGVYQAIGMLEDEGDSLTFYTVPKYEEQSRYRITFIKIGGRIRINFGYEELPRTQGTGTEVILHKTKGISKAERKKLEKYVLKKMGRSRRGPIYNSEDGDKRINNLKDFRHGVNADGNNIKVKYRLGDKGVRYWFDKKGDLHIEDSGTGLQPLKKREDGKEVSAILESLPVPYISTNRTGTELQTALRNKDWTADGEALFYRGKGDAKKTKITIEVGGTEVETIELDGSRLPDELVVDLPTAAGQLQSRRQILLDEVTITAFKGIIDEYTNRFRENPVEYAQVLNALSLLMTRLQNSDRRKSHQRTDNLERYIREKTGEAAAVIDKDKYLPVPNLKENYILTDADGTIDGGTPVYLNEALWTFDPATIGGTLIAASGKSVWKVDRLNIPYVRVGGQTLLIRRSDYEYFMEKSRRFGDNGPLLLDLLFSVWIGYGEKPVAEVEFKGEEPVAAVQGRNLDAGIEKLLDNAGVDKDLHWLMKGLAKRILAEGASDGKTEQKVRYMGNVLKLMVRSGIVADDLRNFISKQISGGDNVYAYPVDDRYFVIDEDEQTLSEMTREGNLSPVITGAFLLDAPLKVGEHVYIDWKPEENVRYLSEIMKDGSVVTVLHGNDIADGYKIEEIDGRVFASWHKDDKYYLTELKQNGRKLSILEGVDFVEKLETARGHVFARWQKDGIYSVSEVRENDVLVHSFPGAVWIDELEYLNGRLFIGVDSQGESLFEIKDDGTHITIFENVKSREYLVNVNGHIFVTWEKDNRWNLAEIKEDGTQRMVITGAAGMSDFVQINGRVFLPWEKDGSRLSEIVGTGQVVPVIEAQGIGTPTIKDGHIYAWRQETGIDSHLDILSEDETNLFEDQFSFGNNSLDDLEKYRENLNIESVNHLLNDNFYYAASWNLGLGKAVHFNPQGDIGDLLMKGKILGGNGDSAIPSSIEKILRSFEKKSNSRASMKNFQKASSDRWILTALLPGGQKKDILSLDEKVQNIAEPTEFHGRIYVRIKKEDRWNMFEVGKDGKLIPVLEGEQEIYIPLVVHDHLFIMHVKNDKWYLSELNPDSGLMPVMGDAEQLSFPIDVNGRLYINSRKNEKWHFYEFKADGSLLQEIADADVVRGPYEAGGREYVEVRKGDRLLVLWPVKGENRWLSIDGTTAVDTYISVQGKEYIRLLTPMSQYSLFKIGEDGLAYPIVEDKNNIMVLDDFPYALVTEEINGPVSLVPLDPLREIASGDALPDLPQMQSLAGGLTDDEKRRLSANLFRNSWSAAELKELGWLLGYVDGKRIKAVGNEVLTLLKKYADLEDDRQRIIGAFIESAGSRGITGRWFDRIMERWLRLYEADPSRAASLIQMLDAQYIVEGQEVQGWNLLKERYSRENIPDTLVLVHYLRNELNLVPLKAGEDRVLEGKPTGSGIHDVLLSSLAGIGDKLQALKSGHIDIAAVAKALAALPPVFEYTEDAIQRNMVTTGYEWLRENIQNALKAVLLLGEQSDVVLNQSQRTLAVTAVPVETQEDGVRKTLFEVRTRDYGKAMDVAEILEKLLALDNGERAPGESEVDGWNGHGWYRNLTGDRVRVVSGKPGSGRYAILEARKTTINGTITWKVDRFEEYEGDFRGTEVTWIREFKGTFEENRILIELEAGQIADDLQKFVGTLPSSRKNGIDITFNGRSIAEKVKEVAKERWNGNEEVRIIGRSSGHTGVLQAGYFVMDIDQDPDLWALVPESLKDFMVKENLALEIPASIPLDRDRAGLAEKNAYIDHLQKAVLSVVLKAAATRLKYDLPRDYMSRPEHLQKIDESLPFKTEEIDARWFRKEHTKRLKLIDAVLGLNGIDPESDSPVDAQRLHDAFNMLINIPHLAELLKKNQVPRDLQTILHREVNAITRLENKTGIAKLYPRTLAKSWSIAQLINNDRWADIDVKKFLEISLIPVKWISLLANLKVFEAEGKWWSLWGLQKEVQTVTRENKEEGTREEYKLRSLKLPGVVRKLVDEVLDNPTMRYMVAATKQEDMWQNKDVQEENLEKEELDERDLSKLELKALIEGFMNPLLREETQSRDNRYRVDFGFSSFPRLAEYGIDWISLNTAGVTVNEWLEWIQRYVRGESDASEDMRIMRDIVESMIHEHVHALELSDEETHNEAFRQRMVDMVLALILFQVAPEEIAEQTKLLYAAEEQKLAAILGENLPAYYRTVTRLRRYRVPESIAKAIALWQVHFKEYTKIMAMSPGEFDLAHGSGNKARRELAATMRADGRNAERNAVSGVKAALAAALTGGGLSLLTFAGIGLLALTRVRTAGEWAGMLVTGVRHVPYDMQAEIPGLEEQSAIIEHGKVLPESQGPPLPRFRFQTEAIDRIAYEFRDRVDPVAMRQVVYALTDAFAVYAAERNFWSDDGLLRAIIGDKGVQSAINRNKDRVPQFPSLLEPVRNAVSLHVLRDRQPSNELADAILSVKRVRNFLDNRNEERFSDLHPALAWLSLSTLSLGISLLAFLSMYIALVPASAWNLSAVFDAVAVYAIILVRDWRASADKRTNYYETLRKKYRDDPEIGPLLMKVSFDNEQRMAAMKKLTAREHSFESNRALLTAEMDHLVYYNDSPVIARSLFEGMLKERPRETVRYLLDLAGTSEYDFEKLIGILSLADTDGRTLQIINETLLSALYGKQPASVTDVATLRDVSGMVERLRKEKDRKVRSQLAAQISIVNVGILRQHLDDKSLQLAGEILNTDKKNGYAAAGLSLLADSYDYDGSEDNVLLMQKFAFNTSSEISSVVKILREQDRQSEQGRLKVKEFFALVDELNGLKRKIVVEDDGANIRLLFDEGFNRTMDEIFAQRAELRDNRLLRYSLALSVARAMKRYSYSIDDEDAVIASARMVGQSTVEHLDDTVIGNDTFVLGIFNDENNGLRFNEGALQRLLHQSGLSPEQEYVADLPAKTPGAVLRWLFQLSGRRRMAKERVLSSIAGLPRDRDTLVYFNGHGLTDRFRFSWLFSVSVQDMGNALIKADRNGVRFRRMTIVFDQCYSYNYAVQLLNYLEQRGVKSFPRIIAVADKNSFGYNQSEVDGSASVSMFLSWVARRLAGTKAAGTGITLGDLLLTAVTDETPRFFIPYQTMPSRKGAGNGRDVFDERKKSEELRRLMNGFLWVYGSETEAIERYMKKEAEDTLLSPQVSALEAAILGENRAAYVKTVARLNRYLRAGTAKAIGLWIVHFKEYAQIMALSLGEFDRLHGSRNAAREENIRAMQTVGRRAEDYARQGFRLAGLGALYMAVTAGSLTTFGTALFAVAGETAIVGARKGAVWAGKIATGNMHVRYDRKAELPMAIFISEDKAGVDTGTFDREKYLPIVITALDKSGSSYPKLKNLGIQAGGAPAWVQEEDGVLFVYIESDPAFFGTEASRVVMTLRGYGNIAPDPRALKILGVDKGTPENMVVFDYTSGGLDRNLLSEVTVVPGVNADSSLGALLNLDRAHKNAEAAETGVERTWSDELLAYERFNSSLVVPATELGGMTAEKVRRLQVSGAKVYVVYEGVSSSEAKEYLRNAISFKADGFFAPQLSRAEMGQFEAMVLKAEKEQERKFVVAGRFGQGTEYWRDFQTVDLSETDYARQIDEMRDGEYPVVRVRLGDAVAADRLKALESLPSSSIVIFSAEDINRNGFLRDLTETGTFGMNLLGSLHLRPQTTGEKKAYQRRLAYELNFGEFEVPEDVKGYIAALRAGEFDLKKYPENADLIAAVKLHLSEEQDPGLRAEFIRAFANRVAARSALAIGGKPLGLEDRLLEEALGEALELVPAVAKVKAVILEGDNYSEVQLALKNKVNVWKALEDRAVKEAQAAEISGSIVQYAEPRRQQKIDKESFRTLDMTGNRALLAAA